MRPIEFYIDGLNHELNLYLQSIQKIERHDCGELLGMLTCGADHDQYKFVVADNKHPLFYNKVFIELFEKVMRHFNLTELTSEAIKSKDYERAKELRTEKDALANEIFSIQRSVTPNEIFFERGENSTIVMKQFSNEKFHALFMYELLYYQDLVYRIIERSSMSEGEKNMNNDFVKRQASSNYNY